MWWEDREAAEAFLLPARGQDQLIGHHSLPLLLGLVHFYVLLELSAQLTRLSAAAIGSRTQPELGMQWQNLVVTPRSCPGETQLASGSDQTGTRQKGS